MIDLIRTAAPSAEMWESDQVSNWVAAGIATLDGNSTDADAEILADLIPWCRELVEEKYQRAILNSTWQLTLDYEDLNGLDVLYLPMPRLVSVSSIKTYDVDNTEATWSSSEYQVVTGENGRIIPGYSYTWPSPTNGYRTLASMVVTFVAGYGTAATDVPGPLRTLLKSLITHFYQHRGDGLYIGRDGWRGEAPPEVDRLLKRFSMYAVPVVG